MSDSDAAAQLETLRHLTGWPLLFEDIKRMGVAVSGGGDSMALLDLMHWHGQEQGIDAHAVTVDHGLRPEAKDEAAMVAAFCAGRGIPHETLHWKWDGTGNLQAAARDARYALIAGWAKSRDIPLVMLGHTRDDVAETFLMRLARGSGVDGLAAMDRRFKRHGVTWCRPLLRCPRADLRGYLRGQGIAWAEDPSNDDPRFDRVKARQVLAALGPLGIGAETLADVAGHIGGAKDALKTYTQHEAQRHAEMRNGDLLVPASLANPEFPVPPEIIRRLQSRALQFVSGQGYPPRRDAMIELEAALFEGETCTSQGCVVTKVGAERRWQDRWRVTREHNAVKDLACPTDAVWDGRWVLDGPHEAALELRALGEPGLRQLPVDWRASGMPRVSLLSSPSVWRGDQLISAPIAGYFNGWRAKLSESRDDFAAWLIRR